MEEESHAYRSVKERETDLQIERWLENAREAWEREYRAQEHRGLQAIRESVNKKWSAFREEQTSLLKERLAEALEKVFPLLAECFILRISEQYRSGTFMLPARFASLVKEASFEVKISEKNEVVFMRGNLYIEYSVERIIEELEEALLERMHMEETVWQA